jgi:hypothetical protein
VSETNETKSPTPAPRNSAELAKAAHSIEDRVRPFLERLVHDDDFRRSLLAAPPQERLGAVRAAGLELEAEAIEALLERWSGRAELGAAELAAVAGGYEEVGFTLKNRGPGGKGFVFEKIDFE